VEAREVDRCGQPRGPAADDEAVEDWLVHSPLTARFVWRFPSARLRAMGAVILIMVILLPLLSAVGAWTQADEVGPVVAAAPIPLLVLLFSIPYGIYLMNTEDGTDMRHVSGFLAVIVGVLLAGLTFGLAWAAGHLKVRRLRRP
jgi:hypothetical protein